MTLVLITGSSGFLGTYLARACVAARHTIYGIDRNPPLEPALWSGFVQGTLAEVNFEKFLGTQHLQTCFHLAGSGSVPYSVAHPYEDFTKLLPGTARLLAYLSQHQPQCHFVLFSSAAVYGSPQILPVSETTPTKPISPYGVHKRLAENLLQDYSTLYGLSGSILRIFSAYGAGLRRQLFWDVLNKYFAALAKGEKTIKLFGTGAESRDYIHAQDVARAAIIASNNQKPQSVQIINVANGIEVTTQTAVDTLLAAIPQPIAVEFTSQPRPGDPYRWVADISQLSAIGYTPTISLHEGLSGYFSWYRKEVKT